MPLFEIGEDELVPFRRVQAGPELCQREIESLLWANVDAFVGVQLFPVARRPATSDGLGDASDFTRRALDADCLHRESSMDPSLEATAPGGGRADDRTGPGPFPGSLTSTSCLSRSPRPLPVLQ